MNDMLLYDYQRNKNEVYREGMSGFDFSIAIQNLFIDKGVYLVDTGNYVNVNIELCRLIEMKIKKHPFIWNKFFGCCFKPINYELKYNKSNVNGYEMSIFVYRILTSKNGLLVNHYEHYQNTNKMMLNFLKYKIKKYKLIFDLFFKIK